MSQGIFIMVLYKHLLFSNIVLSFFPRSFINHKLRELGGPSTCKNIEELCDLSRPWLPLESKNELQRSFGTPSVLQIVGFGLDMQKICPLEVLGLIVHWPKTKITKHLFYLCSSNANPINIHPCIDACHKSTLSSNNFMFKLIKFIEKTRHLYSRIKIKTLEFGKTLFWFDKP